jgi:hypothetical protein
MHDGMKAMHGRAIDGARVVLAVLCGGPVYMVIWSVRASSTEHAMSHVPSQKLKGPSARHRMSHKGLRVSTFVTPGYGNEPGPFISRLTALGEKREDISGFESNELLYPVGAPNNGTHL